MLDIHRHGEQQRRTARSARQRHVDGFISVAGTREDRLEQGIGFGFLLGGRHAAGPGLERRRLLRRPDRISLRVDVIDPRQFLLGGKQVLGDRREALAVQAAVANVPRRRRQGFRERRKPRAQLQRGRVDIAMHRIGLELPILDQDRDEEAGAQQRKQADHVERQARATPQLACRTVRQRVEGRGQLAAGSGIHERRSWGVLRCEARAYYGWPPRKAPVARPAPRCKGASPRRSVTVAGRLYVSHVGNGNHYLKNHRSLVHCRPTIRRPAAMRR